MPALPKRGALLFLVDLNRRELTDALIAYGEADDPLLPLGELTRRLELPVETNPVAGHAQGLIGESQQSLVVDFPARVASIGGERIALEEGDFGVAGADMYIRAALLERLLPLSIAVDGDDLSLHLTSTQPLPVEQRALRVNRRMLLDNMADTEEPTTLIDDPYRWLGIPAAEVALNVGHSDGRGGIVSRFEGRMAADVLKSTFTGYLTTDDRARLAAATVRLERRDTSGGALGPLGFRYAAVGDVYTPALPLGARSYGGAGFSVSTNGLSDGDVFDRITLRGDLPLGYDIELYVNDVLRGSQDRANSGRFEFMDVPLVQGINVIRIVTYGPQGERAERTRVINVGAGLLAPGQLSLNAGVVLQDKPTLDLSRTATASTGLARGKLRGAVDAAFGLTQTLTGTLAMASYVDPAGERHHMATTGARASLFGVAVQTNVSHDFGKGSAIGLNAAGQVAGLSYVARHVEYTGTYLDEANFLAEAGRSLARYSELQLDATLPLPGIGGLPISVQGRRASYRDKGETLQVRARATFSALNTLFALATDYSRRVHPDGRNSTWNGTVAASRRLDKWQLRLTSDLRFLPTARINSMTFTADREIDEVFGLRSGLAKQFGEIRDFTAFAGLNAKLPFADAGVFGDYSFQSGGWSLSLQLSAGFAFDPLKRRPRVVRPGPASGASASFIAFVDSNGNNSADEGEERLAGVKLLAGARPVETDENGLAFVTGLGTSAESFLRIEHGAVDDVFMTSPPQNVTFSARPGQVLAIQYPLTPSSEVVISLSTEQPDGSMVGLSAVRFVVIDDAGKRFESTTQFDGRAIMESMPAGHYRLELDPEQARTLGMSLEKPIEFETRVEGGLIKRSGVILFTREGD